MPAPAPGTVIDRYRVVDLLGAGAMGEVFLAWDEGLHRHVALKILAETHRDNPELRARFLREARAVAAISHPNVVQVFAIGEHEGRPFFSMEYLAGSDLGTIVRTTGTLPSLPAAAAVLDAARGLQAAARAGLIHRDVKPTNLLKLDAGSVKVTDFGLAKPTDPTGDPGLTALGVVVGTPDYIAPEQARGDAIDARADVYALGCTLFYLLVGRAPFRTGDDAEDKYLKVVARHLHDPAPDPRAHAASVDDELAALALEMMRKSPDERPAYDVLIPRLELIYGRLLGAAASTSPAPTGGLTAPRPAPRPSPSRAVAATGPSRELASTGGDTPGVDRATSPVATEPRTPAPVEASRPRARAPRRLASWLVAVSTGLLVAIVAVRLLGPPAAEPPAANARVDGPGAVPASRPPTAPSAPDPATPPSAGTPPATPVAPPAAPVPRPPPEPPPGMLLVRDLAGAPRFFVDRKPVTHAQYAELVPSHRHRAADRDRPVVGVSFADAQAYAARRGKRLLRADEWKPALDTLGFVPAGMRLWEWVDEGNAGATDRPVRRVNDGVDRRTPGGHRSVTFRLAKHLRAR